MIRNLWQSVAVLLFTAIATLLPKLRAMPRLIQFSQHPFVRRGHSKILAGGRQSNPVSMIAAALSQALVRIARPATAVAAVLVLCLVAGGAPATATLVFAMPLAASADPAKVLENLSANFERFQGDLKQTLATQADEIKAHGESSAATSKKVEEMTAQLAQIGQDIKGAQERMQELETEISRPGRGGGEPAKTPGAIFVESDEYKETVRQQRRKSDIVSVGSFFPRAATLTSDAASGGDAIEKFRVAGIITPPDRQLRLRDLLTVVPTSSPAIDYVEETGFTNAAATVAEGAVKPESTLTYDLKTAAAQVIAHWIPATRQILADAPALRNAVDNRLLFGLKIVEETQILYGNGIAPNIQGITTHPDVQTYLWSAGTTGDEKVDAIRRAMTLAQIAEYPVDGVALHPTDWEDIELTKGTDGHYIWVTVTMGGEQRLWRMPVVVTTAVTAGTFVLGAWGLGATLWDREEGNIRVSESHSDFFIRNQVVILAEERVALTIFRPEAFVVGTFDSAPL